MTTKTVKKDDPKDVLREVQRLCAATVERFKNTWYHPKTSKPEGGRVNLKKTVMIPPDEWDAWQIALRAVQAEELKKPSWERRGAFLSLSTLVRQAVSATLARELDALSKPTKRTNTK